MKESHMDTMRCRRRVEIFIETLVALESRGAEDHYHRIAASNLGRWMRAARAESKDLRVEVCPEDWGVVAGRLSRETGECFAILNMANAYFPGGGYLRGAAAQEENMFRRTDCHFGVRPEHVKAEGETYSEAMSRLISGCEGRVYLDIESPRVCVRGPEDPGHPDLGYRWLNEGEIFMFYELRAAAVDCSDGVAFDAAEARRRIAAQLDTLIANEVRHVVLGAFGCGAFANPAHVVAGLYKELICERARHFTRIAFAIHNAGYGPDNYAPFAEAFATHRTKSD